MKGIAFWQKNADFGGLVRKKFVNESIPEISRAREILGVVESRRPSGLAGVHGKIGGVSLRDDFDVSVDKGHQSFRGRCFGGRWIGRA